MQESSSTIKLKWNEIYSLAALSASVAISWIVYHEYQPQLLIDFNFVDLAVFLIIAKGFVLVLTPPLAGWLSDKVIHRTGRFFMIFSIGIGITAMIFMVVASIVGAGPLSAVRGSLPLMIILWLIAMNIFTSPALSMIDSFAPTQKLPIVAGFLFFITQIVYALEPVIVQLVKSIGPTTIFVIGGLLIAVTGYIFHRVSSKDVVTHRRHEMKSEQKSLSSKDLLLIIVIGFILGIGSAFLVEYVPVKGDLIFSARSRIGPYFSFTLLGGAALLAVLSGRWIAKIGFIRVLLPSIGGLMISVLVLYITNSELLFVISGITTALFFALISVAALPFAISKLPARHITFGVGIFIGSSYILGGLFEFLYR